MLLRLCLKIKPRAKVVRTFQIPLGLLKDWSTLEILFVRRTASALVMDDSSSHSCFTEISTVDSLQHYTGSFINIHQLKGALWSPTRHVTLTLRHTPSQEPRITAYSNVSKETRIAIEF